MRAEPRFRPAFVAPLALIALLLAEGAGYAAFYLKFRALPHPFAISQFYQVSRGLMTDHPYLPYLAKKGTFGSLTFNSLGDRGPELESPKRRVRVLCYGGSTTFDGRWPDRLREMLGEDRYEVVIAAQNGATTADTLVNYALIHQDTRPDYVLALEGINDLESSFMPGFRADYAHRRRNIADVPYPIFDRLPRWLNLSSLYVLARWKLVGPRGDLHALFSRPGKYDFKGGPYGLATFERNLASLNLLVKASGARLVLGTPPYGRAQAERFAGAEFAEGWRKGIELENGIVRRLAGSETGVLLADAAAGFPADDEHLVDFCHFTAKGGERVARSFYDALKKAGAR